MQYRQQDENLKEKDDEDIEDMLDDVVRLLLSALVRECRRRSHSFYARAA